MRDPRTQKKNTEVGPSNYTLSILCKLLGRARRASSRECRVQPTEIRDLVAMKVTSKFDAENIRLKRNLKGTSCCRFSNRVFQDFLEVTSPKGTLRTPETADFK